MARFGTVITAMVTPFDGNGALDLDAATDLARWLAANGSDGLVLAGTTGEASVLDDTEKLDLWRAVAEAVSIPVIANTGSNDTRHSVELSHRASDTGVAGVLVVTPYYNRPAQSGIEAHFRAVAAATELPLIIYDIPVRSGRKVAHDVLVRLASEVPNVLGVKDAANDVNASARLVAATPPQFELYSGNDDLTLALLAVGAVGVIGVATHWTGEPMGQMIRSFEAADLGKAREINAAMAESFMYESSHDAPNPVPAKAMMRVLGHPVGECRLPMGDAPAGLEDRARAVLAGLGSLSPATRPS